MPKEDDDPRRPRGRAAPRRRGPGGLDLPRQRRGGQPQRILATLLGDYWHGRGESLPAGAIVELAAPFGITPAGARIALRRLAERRWLVTEQAGRGIRYRPDPRQQAAFDAGARRLTEFGPDPAPWDGTWTVVTFTHPESERNVREMLRGRLRWLGFSDLYGSVWVCPRDVGAQASAALDQLGVTVATVMIARVAPSSPPGGDPSQAWDLPGLRQEYDAFVEEFRPVAATIDAGGAAALPALVVRTRLIEWWRHLADVDPDLPAQLLPAGWPRPVAAGIFARTYDALADAATRHVDAVIRSHDPALAGLAQARTIGPPPGP